MKKNNIYYVYYFLLLLIFCGIILHFVNLSGHSAWADEGTTVYFVEFRDFSGVFSELINTNATWSFQPAYYFILYFWMLLFDSSLTTLRALSAIFGSLSVIVLMFVSWRTWGFQWMCLTGLFAAWSGYGLWYSQEVRPYSLSFFAVSLVLASYILSRTTIRKSQARMWQLCLAIFSMFSVWVSILNAIFLIILAVSDFLFHRSFKSWIRLWVPAALASTTFGVWLVAHFMLVPLAEHRGGWGPDISVFLEIGFVALAVAVGRTYGPPLIDLRTSNYVDVVSQYWPHFVLFSIIAMLILFCLLLILFEKDNKKKSRFNLIQVLCTTFGMVLFLFLLGGAFGLVKVRPRHAFCLWPLLALILPSVVYYHTQILARSRRILGCGAVLGLVLLNAYSVSNYFFDPRHRRDDYKYVAEYISEQRDVLPMLVLGSARALSFYSNREVIDIRKLLPHKSVRTMEVPDGASTIRELASGWNKVVFIINRPFDYLRPDIGEYLSGVLGPEFRPLGEKVPHYFKLYLFERTEGLNDKLDKP